MRSDTSRMCAIAACASSPRRLAWPMASEARLRSALSSSASVTSRRRSASAASTGASETAAPRVARARSTASGFSRISLMSSIGSSAGPSPCPLP